MALYNLEFKKLHPDATIPAYAHLGDSGFDICSIEQTSVYPGQFKLIKTGLAVTLPSGNFELQIRSKSGLAAKYGIFVLNSPGTVDNNYTGEIMIILANLGEDTFNIYKGSKIAQGIVNGFINCNISEIENDTRVTTRGSGGFGSTGI